MMQVKIADLKNNLSKHLDRVRRGQEITVLDRDRPVARIVPFIAGPGPGETDTRSRQSSQRLTELVRSGVVSGGDAQALARWADTHAPARKPAGAPSAVAALIEMRRESRR